jgi:hypothetical protein
MTTNTIFASTKRRDESARPSNLCRTAFCAGLAALLACLPYSAAGQTASQTAEVEGAGVSLAAASVPRLIKYSGTLTDGRGYPITTPIDVAFSLYGQGAQAGAADGEKALWRETQHVSPNEKGGFTVYLGAASASGLPAEVFASASAQWLGIKTEGEPEQARVLLVSVPYALKAGDAQTLGGLPASAFALAGERPSASFQGAAAQSASPDVVPASTVTTTGGVAGYIPEFSGAATIVDSNIYTALGKVGIGTTRPASTLDVAGTTLFQGLTTLGAAGIATATAGASSEPLDFNASSFSALTKAAIVQKFQWQAVPAGSGSYVPSATLNLLTGAGANPLVETGFYFNENGTVHFAAGQTFPGTGAVTGVTAGFGLTGGGTTGAVTLNLDKTKTPTLGAGNTFTGTQIVNGAQIVSGGVESPSFSLPATTDGLDGVINIGGQSFLHGYGTAGSDNVFVGGAGNFTNTSVYTTAVGFQAAKALTTGYSNTALGLNSLIVDTVGNQNTAIGAGALYTNVTGSNNTAVGLSAGAYNGPALSNTTAVGYNSLVLQDNSLVLGNATGNPGAEFVNVGIGTANPISALEASVAAPGAVGAALTLTNPGGDTAKQYGAVAIDFNTQPIQARGYNPGARIEAVDDGLDSDTFYFLFNQGSARNGGLTTTTSIDKYGVTIPGLLTVGNFNSITNPGAEFSQLGNGLQVAGGQNTPSGNGGAGIIGYGGSDGSVAGEGGVFEGGIGPKIGGNGVRGIAGEGGTSNGYAGYFEGDVSITGSVVASSKNFKIDHPQDPANKYLVHASIESSEMVNIYSGNVTTDDLGIAVVHLPDWFEAENGDFRYQLTVMGERFAQAIVSSKIHNHQFTISTNATRVEVSWQVTGVRQDAYAKTHPLVVEQEKSDAERGFYIHPELYGQPEEKQTEWARHPEMMRQVKARREAARQAQKPVEANAAIQPQLGAPASAVDRKFAPVAGPALKAERAPGLSQQAAQHPR